MNLVPAIREIEASIRVIKRKHEIELEPYINSLKELRRINTACEKCAGSGKVWKRACAEDEGDWYKCDVCDGNGENLEKHIESQARSEG